VAFDVEIDGAGASLRRSRPPHRRATVGLTTITRWTNATGAFVLQSAGAAMAVHDTARPPKPPRSVARRRRVLWHAAWGQRPVVRRVAVS
jgi:hypothetical protein